MQKKTNEEMITEHLYLNNAELRTMVKQNEDRIMLLFRDIKVLTEENEFLRKDRGDLIKRILNLEAVVLSNPKLNDGIHGVHIPNVVSVGIQDLRSISSGPTSTTGHLYN